MRLKTSVKWKQLIDAFLATHYEYINISINVFDINMYQV